MQFFRNTRCPPKPIYSCFYSMSQILQKYSYVYRVYSVLDLCERCFFSVIHGLQSVFTFHLPSLSQSMSLSQFNEMYVTEVLQCCECIFGEIGFLPSSFYVRNWLYSFLNWISVIHILILTSMLIQQFFDLLEAQLVEQLSNCIFKQP